MTVPTCRSRFAVDIVALVLTGTLVAAVVGVPLGLKFDVECDPFSLDDPGCTAIIWSILGLIGGLCYLAVIMAKVWWSNKSAPIWSRVVWLVFALLLFPYTVLIYYWFVYRRITSEAKP